MLLDLSEKSLILTLQHFACTRSLMEYNDGLVSIWNDLFTDLHVYRCGQLTNLFPLMLYLRPQPTLLIK